MKRYLVPTCLIIACRVVSGRVGNSAHVTRPAENEILAVGEVYEIVWPPNPRVTGTATLILDSIGAVTNEASVFVADNVEYRSGRYDWIVGEHLDAEQYRVQILLDADGSNVAFSAPFYITSSQQPMPRSATEPKKSGLSDGDIAGIAGGSAVAVLVAICSVWLYRYHKRQTLKRIEAHQAYLRANPELSNNEGSPREQGLLSLDEVVSQPLPVQYKPDEIHGFERVHVVHSDMEPVELPAEIYRRSEDEPGEQSWRARGPGA